MLILILCKYRVHAIIENFLKVFCLLFKSILYGSKRSFEEVKCLPFMVDEKRENMWNKNPKMWDMLFGKDFYVEVIDKSKNISQLK